MWIQLLLAAGLGTLCLGLVVLVRYMKRFQNLERQVDQDSERIEGLGIDAAYRRCESLFSARSFMEEWTQPVPSQVEAVIQGCEPRLAALLTRWRKISFKESGIVISLETPPSQEVPTGMLSIGYCLQNRHKLCVSGSMPQLYEYEGAKLIETYPSLFHLVLLLEGE
jgi:hypothetical protein